MEDGSFIAVDYGVPVHYALDEETWADIDNTLILQSAGASAASTSTAQPMQIPQQYTAVNGDDAKTFAGNLATGFLFSAQRGQSGVQMSLLDGWMAGRNRTSWTRLRLCRKKPVRKKLLSP